MIEEIRLQYDKERAKVHDQWTSFTKHPFMRVMHSHVRDLIEKNEQILRQCTTVEDIARTQYALVLLEELLYGELLRNAYLSESGRIKSSLEAEYKTQQGPMEAMQRTDHLHRNSSE